MRCSRVKGRVQGTGYRVQGIGSRVQGRYSIEFGRTA